MALFYFYNKLRKSMQEILKTALTNPYILTKDYYSITFNNKTISLQGHFQSKLLKKFIQLGVHMIVDDMGFIIGSMTIKKVWTIKITLT